MAVRKATTAKTTKKPVQAPASVSATDSVQVTDVVTAAVTPATPAEGTSDAEKQPSTEPPVVSADQDPSGAAGGQSNGAEEEDEDKDHHDADAGAEPRVEAVHDEEPEVLERESDVQSLPVGRHFYGAFLHDPRSDDKRWAADHKEALVAGRMIRRNIPAEYWAHHAEDHPPLCVRTEKGWAFITYND
jgi:hypothetical protein